MMRSIVALILLVRGVGHLLHGMWTIATRFPQASDVQRASLIADWARGLLRLLNVTLRIQGEPQQQGPLLVVLNHISWLDILVMLAAQPVSFVSKAEVKRWPLIGWLATHAGTLYIERSSRKDAMRVVHHMAEALRSGRIVAVFPEGTTSDGSGVLPFHANLLQSAIACHAPVQPVALRFLQADGQLSRNAAYIGDDTLMGSVWRMLRAEPITASLDFMPSVSAQGWERRALAAHLQQLIQARVKT